MKSFIKKSLIILTLAFTVFMLFGCANTEDVPDFVKNAKDNNTTTKAPVTTEWTGSGEAPTTTIDEKASQEAADQRMAKLNYPDFPLTGDEKNSWEYLDPSQEYTVKWYVDVSSWVIPTGVDEVSKYIKQKTGITVQFETPVADDGTKLTTMIAGDTLPDIISLPTSNQQDIASLAQQGFVYDINTLATKWAPSLFNNLPEDVLNWWAFGNGKTYGIPNHYYSYEDVLEDQLQPNGGMMVREDIFNAWQEHCKNDIANTDGFVYYDARYRKDESGAPLKKKVEWQGYITTPEGFYDAAKWALENYYGTTKGKITTGLELSQFTSTGCTSLIWLSQFFAVPFEDQNGNYQYGFTQEGYKEMLMYLNDLYNAGIIKDSNFTQNYNGVGGVIASGQCFATLATPQDYQMHFVTAKNSGCKYISMYITNEDGDAPVLADIRGYGYLMNMITTNCSRPDIVIKLFDYLTSKEGQRLITLGIEGVTWNFKDDTKEEIVFTDKYLEEKSQGIATKYGLMQFDLLINYQYYDNVQPRTNNGKTVDEVFRTDLKRPLTIYSYDYNATHFVVDATDPRFNDYLTALNKIENLIGKQLPKIIKAPNNSKALEIYESTISTMNKYNFELVISMMREAYIKYKAKLNVEYAWPPYNSGFNNIVDRTKPNGDTSYYRGTY